MIGQLHHASSVHQPFLDNTDYLLEGFVEKSCYVSDYVSVMCGHYVVLTVHSFSAR